MLKHDINKMLSELLASGPLSSRESWRGICALMFPVTCGEQLGRILPRPPLPQPPLPGHSAHRDRLHSLRTSFTVT